MNSQDKMKQIASLPFDELKRYMASEPVASFFQANLVELSPGYAKVKMKMRPEYQNFHKVVQGGVVLTLADFALGYATNSANFPTVAWQLNFYLLAPTECSDELTAECRLVKDGRRVGLSEITVTNQKGQTVLKATATSVPIGKGAHSE